MRLNWSDWFKAWVAHGLDPARFWRTTPREAALAVEAAGDRDWLQFRQGQTLAYSLAQLMGTGFHQPRKMPKFDKVFPDRKARRVAGQAPEDDARNLDLWLRAFATFNTKGRRPQ